MKAKSTSRSGSPAMSSPAKSPSKSAARSPSKPVPKSPPKTVGKLSTNAAQTKTSAKSAAKDLPKSPAKSKSPSPGAKQTAKQPKPAEKKAMKKTPEKAGSGSERSGSQNRGKSPRPASKASSSKGSQTAKAKIAAKQRETRISNLKAKTVSQSKKKAQNVLGNCKKTPLKKTPSKIVAKTKKKKIERELSTSQFIDLWTLANIGKREASLNASMKVNIMYESAAKSPPKQSPIKTCNDSEEVKDKAQQDKSTPKKSASENKDQAVEKEEKKTKRPMLSVCKGTKSKKLVLSTGLKVRQKSGLCSPSKTLSTEQRKRKSPHYKIFKEEPVSKSRKIEAKKTKPAVKSKVKAASKAKKKKKKSKVAPSGHHLCNIIEKSPRQASLIAKAMIAMEQEEDVVLESAARTKVYDWQELRPPHQSNRRRIVWVPGLVKSIKDKEDKSDVKVDTNGKDPTSGSLLSTSTEPSEALHSALLRTLHEVGDPRLLREFYRAQRDDFPGFVDVEKCDPPPPPPKKEASPPTSTTTATTTVSPVKEVPTSRAKSKPAPVAASPPVKKPPKVGVSDKKSGTCSPAKPQPCRVATPIPQFPLGQRTSHMTSFIHHPMSHQHQRLHQQQQEQQKQAYPQQQTPQQAHTHHPQPIKVTPYSPGPAFIYQFVSPPPPSPSPSPLTYGLGGTASPAPHGDFQSSFTLNHMGTLSLGRRGVNPYDPTYNSSMQQVGE